MSTTKIDLSKFVSKEQISIDLSSRIVDSFSNFKISFTNKKCENKWIWIFHKKKNPRHQNW